MSCFSYSIHRDLRSEINDDHRPQRRKVVYEYIVLYCRVVECNLGNAYYSYLLDGDEREARHFTIGVLRREARRDLQVENELHLRHDSALVLQAIAAAHRARGETRALLSDSGKESRALLRKHGEQGARGARRESSRDGSNGVQLRDERFGHRGLLEALLPRALERSLPGRQTSGHLQDNWQVVQ